MQRPWNFHGCFVIIIENRESKEREYFYAILLQRVNAMKGSFSKKKKTILARAIVLGLCLGVFSHARAANPSGFETPEYFKSTGLDIINASAAYAKGYTGKGVTIGVSDDAVNFTSPEFSTKQNTTLLPDVFPTYQTYEGKVYTVEDEKYWSFFDHGSHVAGIAAASRNDLGMHGVAFDAEVLSSANVLESGDRLYGNVRKDWAETFFEVPGLKIVNVSWGNDTYVGHYIEENETMQDYIAAVRSTPKLWERVEIFNSMAGKDKLFVFAAGNRGNDLPTVDAGYQWLSGKNTSTVLLSVTALEDGNRLKRSGEGIEGVNILDWLSNMAAFNEDATIAAPGSNIVSANARYALDGEIDMSLTGTSMAAPHVAGAAALVQQAFPWMTAKQIGDTLLSTANPNITSANGYTVIINGSDPDIYYFDGRERSLEEQREDCEKYLRTVMSEKKARSYVVIAEFSDFILWRPIRAHYNVPMEALTGQGILDAGKAVDGPGALNARRLETSDISSAYTVGGKAASQALYKVDTQGYDSTWANDIKEVRVGLLAADSTEEDLQKRYNYYKSNWLDRTEYSDGKAVKGTPFVKAYIDFYNDNALASKLVDLPVGLLKSGEGRLSLTGNNTYKGASIARQGTLSIDGSVAGDAYSVEQGTIAGRGTIHGTLYNQNIAVAGDATGNGNLTMDKLISSGVLLSQYQNGTSTQFIVNGEADINGSTVPLPTGAPTPMPDDRYTVVKAASITGTAKDLAGTEYELSGMLSAKNEIEGGNLSVVVEAANNLNGADAAQNETFDAMVAMYRNLKRNNDPRMNEMQPLFYMDGTQAKEALSAISSNASVQSMAVTQRSMMTHHILSSRLNEAFMPKPVKVELPSANLNDSAADSLDISLNLLEPAENDIWLKFGKNWGDVQGNTDYHSSTTMLGYDKAVAPHWRVGAFAGYSSTSFADNTANNELKDTRFGLYAGYNKAGKEALLYLDYGWMRNKLRRGLTNLGLAANARYHSRILELGGEYLYDLHAGKNVPWHVRPYVNAQLSRLWQDGYSEEGAGVYNQVVDSKHNNYFGMGAGVEFKRYLPCGNYVIRAGVRHAFAGAEPRLRYSYMGDQANTYDMRNVQDKTHFVLSIGGEAEVAKGWSVGGDVTWQRGRHDKDLSCSVMVKRMW